MAATAVPVTHQGARRRPLLARSAGMLLAYGILVALLVVYYQKSPRFTEREMRSIANQGMTLTIVGLGQTVVVLTGGIDLSVGPMVSLTNSIASRISGEESPNRRMALAAAAALLVGAAGGFVNGVLIAYGQLHPIIVTLATASIYGGIALQVRPSPGGFIPFNYVDLLTGLYRRQVPKALFLLLALVAVWLVFRRTRLSTRIYAVGSAEGAAYMSGLAIDRAKLAAFTLAGFFAAVGGLYLALQTSSGNADVPQAGAYTLNSIAAVVIGGTSLMGGRGTVRGALIGAFVIGFLADGLVIVGVSTFWQIVIKGAVIVLAVILDQSQQRIQKRSAAAAAAAQLAAAPPRTPAAA